MEITVLRFSDSEESTLGLMLIDGEFACYTLEDAYHKEKIYSKTRIPDGTYDVELRTEGGFHERYSERFPLMHRGMLHLKDVPNYKYILIHIGNTADDTAGCILVGDSVNNNKVTGGFLSSSTKAYKRVYPVISKAILNGEKVTITLKDITITLKDIKDAGVF